MMKKERKPSRNSPSDRFVNFTSGAIRVDVERFLKSSQGKEALERLERSNKYIIKKVAAAEDRSKIRSRTFEGIAEAMAEQWG